MAAAPVLVPIESSSTEHHAETLQFQRLERIRAQRRARRRYQLFVVTTLAIALAGAGVVGFMVVRRTSFERLGSPGLPSPVELVNPAAALPATQPPRVKIDADQRSRPLSGSRERSEVAPARNEPHDAAVDPMAAIDWLLKTSRTRSADGRGEKLQ